MARAVTVIPPTINPLTKMPTATVSKQRVAGYARVSTDSDEQFTSYEAQIDYYTQFIMRHSDWEFVKVYTDEGISGTNTKRREGFNQMITDALDGKIDLIVTKSVSRFARNTVDSLVTVRKLKEKGVEVFFEKENIYTLDSKGELLITIMSSLAQEESRSISENVTWGQRKRFADGKVMLPYKRFLGYRKGADGFPEIVPEEAEIVKRIYRRYMSGQTTCAIAAELTADGIPTPGGKATWQASTVESILTNEKYKGDALLQKCFTTDFLTKKKKVNEGEVPQYYVEHSHEAIIPPNEWEDVQTEIQRRKRIGRKYSGNGIFASRIVCAECGSFFGAKVWHSNNEKYRKTIWRCNHKFDGEHRCQTPFVEETTLKDKFVTAFNTLWDTRAEIIENLRFAQMLLTDSTAIDTELEKLTAELEIIVELTRKCIEENSTFAQDQNEYTARYNGYVERYESTQARIQELQKQKAERKEKYDAFESFIFAFASQEKSLTEFDEGIWCLLMETVTVDISGELEFRFKDGSTIKK